MGCLRSTPLHSTTLKHTSINRRVHDRNNNVRAQHMHSHMDGLELAARARKPRHENVGTLPSITWLVSQLKSVCCMHGVMLLLSDD